MKMIGQDIWECRGKTIKTVIAFDPVGYDKGFEIVFTDGTKLEIYSVPVPIKSNVETGLRIKIKNTEKQKGGFHDSSKDIR